MRIQSVSEIEGGVASNWNQSDRPCRYCKAVGQRCYRVWESSDGACTDEQNECWACGKVWWDEEAESWLNGGRFPLPGQAVPGRSRATAATGMLMAVLSTCSLIGFGVFKELARRMGH